MVDLYYRPSWSDPLREDERFHWQHDEPSPVVSYPWWGLGLVRKVTWDGLTNADGSVGTWTNWTLRLGRTDVGGHFRALQVYHGTAKMDGGATELLRHWILPNSTEEERLGIVVCDTPSEMNAWRIKSIDEKPVANNMGGA